MADILAELWPGELGEGGRAAIRDSIDLRAAHLKTGLREAGVYFFGAVQRFSEQVDGRGTASLPSAAQWFGEALRIAREVRHE